MSVLCSRQTSIPLRWHLMYVILREIGFPSLSPRIQKVSEPSTQVPIYLILALISSAMTVALMVGIQPRGPIHIVPEAAPD